MGLTPRFSDESPSKVGHGLVIFYGIIKKYSDYSRHLSYSRA